MLFQHLNSTLSMSKLDFFHRYQPCLFSFFSLFLLIACMYVNPPPYSNKATEKPRKHNKSTFFNHSDIHFLKLFFCFFTYIKLSNFQTSPYLVFKNQNTMAMGATTCLCLFPFSLDFTVIHQYVPYVLYLISSFLFPFPRFPHSPHLTRLKPTYLPNPRKKTKENFTEAEEKGGG